MANKLAVVVAGMPSTTSARAIVVRPTLARKASSFADSFANALPARIWAPVMVMNHSKTNQIDRRQYARMIFFILCDYFPCI
jgi:hypothetical protein